MGQVRPETRAKRCSAPFNPPFVSDVASGSAAQRQDVRPWDGSLGGGTAFYSAYSPAVVRQSVLVWLMLQQEPGDRHRTAAASCFGLATPTASSSQPS